MLRKRILDKIEKCEGITQKSLAKIAGVTEPPLSRYLNGISDEMGFEQIRRIIKHLFPEKEREYMAEYALTQELQNARYCLEYTSIHNMHDITYQLIAELAASKNRTDREWAKAYQYFNDIAVQQHEPVSFLKRLDEFIPKQDEMKILKTIAKCQALFQLDKHREISDLLNKIAKDIEELISDFMKESLNTRVNLILNNIFLYQNNIDEAREASRYVINQEIAENIKGGAYLNLGHSYLFEDYEKARRYYLTALSFFNQRGRDDLVVATKNTISFLQSYYKIDREYTYNGGSYQEKSDYIYYLAQKGDRIRAKELLNEIDINTLPDWNKGFYYYYLGLIEESKQPFFEAVKWYRLTSNFFHLQLPIKALRELGENETILEIFTNQ